MLSAIGLAAARQVRVAGRLSIRRAAQFTARPAIVIPSGIRIAAVAARCYAESTKTKKSAKTKSTATATKRKATAAKTATKKAAADKADTAKKSRAGRKKKELTPEEKTKLKIKELKKKALLEEIPRLPSIGWAVYTSERLKEKMRERAAAQTDEKWSLKDLIPQIKKDYDALPAEELEKLQATAEQNRLANEVAFKNWIDSHSPREIYEANRARSLLRRKYNKSVRHAIPDPRIPKAATPAFNFFIKTRYQSQEFAHERGSQVLPKLAAEWKSLSAEERKPFEDMAALDKERYEKEISALPDWPSKT
ncbi:hypothetical protein VTK26DRAFT_9237 [Humicola hyalothermophila]